MQGPRLETFLLARMYEYLKSDDTGTEHLPAELGSLVNPEELNLGRNGMTSVPAQIVTPGKLKIDIGL
jgi:hypothetical protein